MAVAVTKEDLTAFGVQLTALNASQHEQLSASVAEIKTSVLAIATAAEVRTVRTHDRIDALDLRINGRLVKAVDGVNDHEVRVTVLEKRPKALSRREFWSGVSVLGTAGGVILWVVLVAQAAKEAGLSP